ncbi:MAG: bifunctional riboflavin kinase/FMN adenylyltransferase [Verrucomicrobia bacterium]|nr:bifunctional riboflavin kinase/FMN adenylyltransferase [Verrucomicrobiota bacterium]MBU1735817.1 bifunctional riboflavin kinase/FMN adenylyltransferase [Verrucomicrobiota bacterium]
MKLGFKLACLRGQRRPVLLAAGFFDGVHRGHQAIIRKIVSAARRERGAAWVMTFDTHPRKVLFPLSAPRLLTSTQHKLRLLKALGVHGCIVIPFTRSLARREPKAFIAMLALAAPALRQIVIGRNWTFGRQGCGTPAMLKALAPVYGFKITVIPPVRWHGAVVSSTRIRAAVLAGRLAEAAGMLGRPFNLLGTVVPGRGLGRKLGIPTANLNPHNEVTPPDGVYIVRARWDGVAYPGIVNLGVRPTVTWKNVKRWTGQWTPDAGRRTPEVRSQNTLDAQRSTLHVLPPSRVLELHLFGLRRNLYGKAIEVTFLKKLRRERVFPSLAALQRQIRKDIEKAKAWFERK